jgi:Ca-activated chloride channel family protein
MEKTTVEQPRYMEYREFAPNLAIVVALLLLLGFVADHTWKMRLP